MQIPQDVHSALEQQGTIIPDDPQDPATVLGQAFLAPLSRYTIDNERHVLMLE